MKPNPPIAGHHLLYEGLVYPMRDGGWDRSITGYRGGCQCGANPPRFPNVSRSRMQEWHRDHKAELRATLSLSNVTPLHPPTDTLEQIAADFDTLTADIARDQLGLRPEYRAVIGLVRGRYRNWCDRDGGGAA